MSDEQTITQILRKQFPANQIGHLPRGGIQIDYVGHADVTSRLLEADPDWTWEPQTRDVDKDVLAAAVATGNPEMVRLVLENAPPKFEADKSGNPVGLWIRLTVGGVTRPGYGNCPGTQTDPEKVLIGDALRNAAMRFGVAIDLWAKGDRADPTRENSSGPGGQAARHGRQEQQRPSQSANGQAVKAQQPAPPASRDEVDEDAQPFAEEASQCRTVAALSEVNRKAREARKLSSLIRNPATGGTGGLGQYIAWLRHQLEDAEEALKELMDAAGKAGVDVSEIDAHVLKVTGAGVEAATAAQLRQAAAALAKDPVAA